MCVNCIVVYEYQEEPAKFVIAYLREVWLGGDSDPRYDPRPQDLEDVREPKTPSILDRAPFFHVTCSPLQRYWRVGTVRPCPPSGHAWPRFAGRNGPRACGGTEMTAANTAWRTPGGTTSRPPCSS